MFSFKYSPRPNTPALSLDDAIPEEEKSRRLEVLMAQQREIQISRYTKYVGEQLEVMVEGYNPARGQWIGRTSQNKTLNFTAPEAACDPKLGSYVPVRVTRKFSQQPGGRTGNVGAIWRITMEVEMTIRGLMMDPVTNMPIVILKDVGGETVLPIWVGVYEANAIALEMEKVATPRPDDPRSDQERAHRVWRRRCTRSS